MTDLPAQSNQRTLPSIETNGLNTINEAEKHGRAADLFWPWFASNVSVLSISYGSFVLNFGISFWQAITVSTVSIVLSFLLCGLVAVAGKQDSAPTMTLSRATFGVMGNRLPSALSWIATVGWETVITALAALATSTVLVRLGWHNETGAHLVGLIVVSTLTIVGGIYGFRIVMRIQKWITLATATLTLVYLSLTLPHINWSAAWTGIFLADLTRRKGPLYAPDLQNPAGKYRAVQWPPVLLLITSTVTGWGLITNHAASWLHWQGFLFHALDAPASQWAESNIGIPTALILGFAVRYVTNRTAISTRSA